MLSVELREFLESEGYSHLRVMPNGEIAGIQSFMFTYGLVLGLDHWGYRTRFCFPSKAEAVAALKDWDGEGFPPGFWIKQKPENIPNPDLQNPAPSGGLTEEGASALFSAFFRI